MSLPSPRLRTRGAWAGAAAGPRGAGCQGTCGRGGPCPPAGSADGVSCFPCTRSGRCALGRPKTRRRCSGRALRAQCSPRLQPDSAQTPTDGSRAACGRQSGRSARRDGRPRRRGPDLVRFSLGRFAAGRPHTREAPGGTAQTNSPWTLPGRPRISCSLARSTTFQAHGFPEN